MAEMTAVRISDTGMEYSTPSSPKKIGRSSAKPTPKTISRTIESMVEAAAFPIACKKMLAYIPDNPDLYEFMTGIQYLNFIADIFGVEESARQERIRKYADLFGLTTDLAQPVAAYSHGMKQKLAIISAWLHEPKLILMDEPSMGLSPIFVNEIFEIIKKVSAAGTTVLLVEQNAKKALSIADRAYVLETGKIILQGDADKLLNDESVKKAYLGE